MDILNAPQGGFQLSRYQQRKNDLFPSLKNINRLLILVVAIAKRLQVIKNLLS